MNLTNAPTFAWPTIKGKIIQRFGENPDKYKKYGFPGHDGIDILVPKNTPVLASAAGRVISGKIQHEGNRHKRYGNHVILEHPLGEYIYYTLYAHLSSVMVNKGDLVETEDVIGISGDTGNAQIPYLHFGVRKQYATQEGETSFPQDVVNPIIFLFRQMELGI